MGHSWAVFDIVALILLFLCFVLFQGDPDIHDAIVKWAIKHAQ